MFYVHQLNSQAVMLMFLPEPTQAIKLGQVLCYLPIYNRSTPFLPGGGSPSFVGEKTCPPGYLPHRPPVPIKGQGSIGGRKCHYVLWGQLNEIKSAPCFLWSVSLCLFNKAMIHLAALRWESSNKQVSKLTCICSSILCKNTLIVAED